MRTVALNLTQKISVISRPLRQSLPPERSLRSAHRLSAESRSKAKAQAAEDIDDIDEIFKIFNKD